MHRNATAVYMDFCHILHDQLNNFIFLAACLHPQSKMVHAKGACQLQWHVAICALAVKASETLHSVPATPIFLPSSHTSLQPLIPENVPGKIPLKSCRVQSKCSGSHSWPAHLSALHLLPAFGSLPSLSCRPCWCLMCSHSCAVT
jgi:hypothetical protein